MTSDTGGGIALWVTSLAASNHCHLSSTIWDTAKKCSCPIKVIGEKDNDGLIVYAFALYPTIDSYTDTYIVYSMQGRIQDLVLGGTKFDKVI